MTIPSGLLDAFTAVVVHKSFSRAAKSLHVTQSALSQRMRQLEVLLGTTLLLRGKSGVQLTEAGEKLLQYCKIKGDLELEFLNEINSHQSGELGGIIRIAAQSSIMRPVIFPALAEFLRKNPKIQVHFMVREMEFLPPLLLRSEVDFLFLDEVLSRKDVVAHTVGEECFVMMENMNHKSNYTYLDAGPSDKITEKFLELMPRRVGDLSKYRRSFMQDEFGIIEGVIQGWGKAVVAKHMVPKHPFLKIIRPAETLRIPVVMHYRKQPYYTKLHHAVRNELMDNMPKLLKFKD